jgi:D-3-phosphoglycerate dehydrogenase
MDWSFMRDRRIVRLNARLFPAGDFERAQWRRFGMAPLEFEAATPAEIIPHVAQADALFAVSVSLPPAVIERLERCQVISRLGTGTDKIAVDVARQRGILVTNVPYFCVAEQADHAMAMLLALARQLPQGAADMKAGAYRHAQAAVRSNRRLEGRVLGLVGFGNSARHMARRAAGFGLRVLATRRRIGAADPEAAALGVEMADLDTVLRQSDYLSLHLPLVADTYHLIDAAALARMKPDAFLINTSRGALVDEDALHAALVAGRLAGAGLDTFEGVDVFAEDGTPPDLALLRLPNVIATPHVAAGSVEAGHDVSRGGVENVAAILAGCWPPAENVVNAGVVPRTALRPFDPALLA